MSDVGISPTAVKRHGLDLDPGLTEIIRFDINYRVQAELELTSSRERRLAPQRCVSQSTWRWVYVRVSGTRP
jgi:hypothetical protein